MKAYIIIIALLLTATMTQDVRKLEAQGFQSLSVVRPRQVDLRADTSGWTYYYLYLPRTVNPSFAQFRGVVFIVNVTTDLQDPNTHNFALYTNGFPPGSVSTSDSCSLTNTNGCLARSGDVSPSINPHWLHFNFTSPIPVDDFTGLGKYEYYCQYHPSTMHGKITLYKSPDVDFDGSVTISDISTIALAFGSSGTPSPTPRWDPSADVDNNGVVSILDVAFAAFYFGQTI